MLIKPLDLSALSRQEIAKYKKLLPKFYWPALRGNDPWDIQSAIVDGISIVDKDDDVPMGLAFSSYYPNLFLADLICLDVYAKERYVEIIPLLFKGIEETLKKRKCSLISYIYLQKQPQIDVLEEFLKKDGWTVPRVSFVRCHFYVNDFHPSWMVKSHRLPLECSILPWSYVSEDEIYRLKDAFKRGNIPQGYSPFESTLLIAHINSVALFDKSGNVVGWMVCHFVDKNTLKYTSLFVEREYRSTTVFLALLAMSIRLQQETAILKSCLEVNVDQVEHNWVQFIKKRLLPYTYDVEKYCSTSKKIL